MGQVCLDLVLTPHTTLSLSVSVCYKQRFLGLSHSDTGLTFLILNHCLQLIIFFPSALAPPYQTVGTAT